MLATHRNKSTKIIPQSEKNSNVMPFKSDTNIKAVFSLKIMTSRLFSGFFFFVSAMLWQYNDTLCKNANVTTLS